MTDIPYPNTSGLCIRLLSHSPGMAIHSNPFFKNPGSAMLPEADRGKHRPQGGLHHGGAGGALQHPLRGLQQHGSRRYRTNTY